MIIPGVRLITTTGSYTGDNTDDRAIAHGLGHLPSLVVIVQTNGAIVYLVYKDEGAIRCVTTPTYTNVQGADATYFYVGDVINYTLTANFGGQGYKWAAI